MALYAWLLGLHSSYQLTLLFIAAMLIWRHRSNIRNLLAGTEDKIGTQQ